uniref:Bromo domain-containing protein n=1 Tax=Prymnesium polylepis TaxID=72548 RepID=A0A7S4HDN0_9EUKA|mmetsp:Transcript_27203/g.73092  ORF Transcript_27203/g.73092 Transcript_27203/m.73092 type:complete len:168 (-) Transcript_27203:1509-2012(-)
MINRRSKRTRPTTSSVAAVNPSLVQQRWTAACLNVVRDLRARDKASAWRGIFGRPVDPVAFPDYLDAVPAPMDLGTIERALMAGRYAEAAAFAADVSRVWQNAVLYNGEGSAVAEWAAELEKMFEARFAERVPPAKGETDEMEEMQRDLKRMKAEVRAPRRVPATAQ